MGCNRTKGKPDVLFLSNLLCFMRNFWSNSSFTVAVTVVIVKMLTGLDGDGGEGGINDSFIIQ